MIFTHHIQGINFSLVYRIAACIGLLAAQLLRISVLRYYHFNIAGA